MNKSLFQKLLPHFVALILFFCLSFWYFSPVLEGKQLMGHDTQSWLYSAKETIDYNQTHDDKTLWTNSMFGGMPTYQISMTQPNNIIKYVDQLIKSLPSPVFFLVLYLLCFYILLLAFGINPWLAIIGSFAFSFASYNFIILSVGHNSKAITIAYIAPLIGSIYMAFRSKRMLGSLLTALFLSLAIYANHIQILYYTLLMVLVFGLVELIFSIKEKKASSYFKTLGLLIIAALLAAGMNATSLLTTYEYNQYTMRGKSTGLTLDEQNAQHGLNKDYITQWSYGIDETLTLLIPNFKGGASAGTLSSESKTAQRLSSYGVPNVERMMKEMQLPLYWGNQPGTAGPVYVGAIVCFLFVLGIFLVDKRTKWWLLPLIVLSIMLSWGKNFMPLTDFFIRYIPFYNNFRTVSMILVIASFGMALMAILALKEVFNPATDKAKLLRPVSISAAIVGGICLIFAVVPSLAGNFVSPADGQFTGDYAFLKETLPLDREALLRSDALRSLTFVILCAGLIWLYAKNLVKKNLAYVLLGCLMLGDLVPVAKRYLNDDNFTRKRSFEKFIQPSVADKIILQDKSQFRVLDATVDIFNDASPSYFHKNIGGYHAAKLRRYQELINIHLTKELGQLFGAFGRAKTIEEIVQVMDSLGVLNMLNMKYVIYNKEAPPLVNPYANGNAWLVTKVRIAENADEEMRLLGEINTKTEVVVDKSFSALLPPAIIPDSSAHIQLVSYEPNHLIYNFSSKTDQLAVFSEIYYDKGWNAYINGKKVPYIRANYLLRAMPLKAGSYQIEFKFEPDSYRIGNSIALVSSILFVLWLVGYIYLRWKKPSMAKKIDQWE
ncbi:MAG TPA: YfhO family protein [Paludibacteraceae bacterium]|nr:YfhO family protein [Paludibacteraceae bacterium]